ncbi:MAG: hypothetical protein AAGB01_03320 [Cyanobacteria bacterium P01_F01_bin.42]
MAKNYLILFFLISSSLLGCAIEEPAPQSIQETSAVRQQLSDRISFIEQYVTFKRSYDQLEYDVAYYNNGGGRVPGPSDWDIKLRAVVPTASLDEWVPSNSEKSVEQPPSWLREIPGSIPVDDITEWYRDGKREVGIDRSRSIIAYRNTTY